MPDDLKKCKMKIKIFTTGGTIDKIYFDAKDDYQCGHSEIDSILKKQNVNFDYAIESILKKDSLNLTNEDRGLLFEHVKNDSSDKILITHGTDTMIETALKLLKIKDKTIVLTGSMQPARMHISDAEFNIGSAIIALQTLKHGVYIVINGQIFDPQKSRKNIEEHRFEKI